MNQSNEQLFPSEFIINYIQDGAKKERFLIYTAFRFLSFAGNTDDAFPTVLKSRLPHSPAPEDFTVVEDYLRADYYFSPSLTLNSYEPLYLYTAITLLKDSASSHNTILDELISTYAPTAAGLSYSASTQSLSALLTSGADFYAGLYLAASEPDATFRALLPRFTEIYREEYHFTCEDFILFDFMDAYFEQSDCIHAPAFTELVDTLVAATLNYYNTDFGTLIEGECSLSLAGASSRFAGTKRFGSVALPAIRHKDKACRILAELFRYAAIYELRSNLFDFHLEDDKLITLDNWKENLRWHYVQYANVYQGALDSFHTAMLSLELLKTQFARCIV